MEQIHHNFPTKAGRLAGVFKKRHPSSLSKKVCPPLGPLCEGDSPQRGEMSRSDRGAWARRAPPAGGGGENCTAARNISGYGKVLSLRPFGAPPSQREVFRHAEPPLTGEPAERSDGLRGFSRSPQSPIFPSIFKQISKFRPNFPAFCNNSETFVVIIDSTPFQKTSCRKEAPL